MIIAFDTSCYTTSVALMSVGGRLLADKRRLLSVPPGESGLRQSNALFQHVQALPALVEEALAGVERNSIRAVAAATRPRPYDNSYMPVFTAGANAGRLLSLALQIPFLAFSHQEGHIAAALWSLDLDWRGPFIAAHISGGTNELLWAQPHETGFMLEIIGGSDLPAGQFIDRVGVALGLPFPAGPHLEQLALSAPSSALRLSGTVNGTQMSFSGPESAAQRLIKAGAKGAELARAVFDNIGASLGQAIGAAAAAHNCTRVLVAGGVAANSLVRRQVEENTRGLEIHFALPAYTGDNAVGGAYLAARCQRTEDRKQGSGIRGQGSEVRDLGSEDK